MRPLVCLGLGLLACTLFACAKAPLRHRNPIIIDGHEYRMKDACERCGTPLGFDDVAYVCGYECTFCPSCTQDMRHICPNCSGDLVERPGRGRLKPRD